MLLTRYAAVLCTVLAFSFSENTQAGVTITKDGIRTSGGVEIDEKGVRTPGGVEVDDGGVKVGGVTIKSDEGKNASPDASGALALKYVSNNMAGTDLSGRDLTGLVVQSSNFSGVNFSGSVLENARLQSSNFGNANFSSAHAAGARLQSSQFNGANFQGANLRDARLQASSFRNADFRGACLINAKLQTSNFTGADFTDAIVVGADFASSSLAGAKMDGAIRSGVADCPETSGSRPEVTSADQIEQKLAKGDNARIDLTVNFAHDSDRIEGAAHAQIVEIGRALQSDALAGANILIEGHTDADGDDSYNLDLSYRRALAVMMALIRDHGIPVQRLSIRGFGESQPVATNATDAGKALNRRVTLVNQGN